MRDQMHIFALIRTDLPTHDRTPVDWCE